MAWSHHWDWHWGGTPKPRHMFGHFPPKRNNKVRSLKHSNTDTCPKAKCDFLPLHRLPSTLVSWAGHPHMPFLPGGLLVPRGWQLAPGTLLIRLLSCPQWVASVINKAPPFLNLVSWTWQCSIFSVDSMMPGANGLLQCLKLLAFVL